jgi:hypothetical protein
MPLRACDLPRIQPNFADSSPQSGRKNVAALVENGGQDPMAGFS